VRLHGTSVRASQVDGESMSSGTPALLVPKQRHAQCRADLGQGPEHTLKNIHTTNHQSPNVPVPVLMVN